MKHLVVSFYPVLLLTYFLLQICCDIAMHFRLLKILALNFNFSYIYIYIYVCVCVCVCVCMCDIKNLMVWL